MSQTIDDREQVREAVKDVLKGYFRIAAIVFFSLVMTLFGFLIAVSSFNRTSILLTLVGFVFGIGVVAVSVGTMYRTVRE